MQDQLTINIKKSKRGGFICTVDAGDGTPDDLAVSTAMETMKFVNDVFFERFAEHCYLPAVVYMPAPAMPQHQTTQQQHAPQRPDIPPVEPFNPPSFMQDKVVEDQGLVHRLGKRMNGVAVIAFMVCIGASKMLGA